MFKWRKTIRHFPDMSDSVMDTLLDLVEDDEAVVRTVMLYIIKKYTSFLFSNISEFSYKFLRCVPVSRFTLN